MGCQVMGQESRETACEEYAMSETQPAGSDASSGAPRVRHVIGCMTGTSLDGLDAVLTRITGTGKAMTAEYVGMVSAPLPDDLRQTLMRMASGEALPPIEFMRAARHLGVVHAEACMKLAASHGRGARPDFVIAHGQTIWHAPQDTLSWQLFDPWPIVRMLKVPVCYDLRQADLIAGGQGAPIMPVADAYLFRQHDVRVVLNLGGIASTTVLHSVAQGSQKGLQIQGGDVGPCNILLDRMCQVLTGQPFDRDGSIASRGKVHPIIDDRVDESLWYQIHRRYSRLSAQDKSLGREDFTVEMIDQILNQVRASHSVEDLLRNAVESVAQDCGSVCCAHGDGTIVLAGGGSRNQALVAAMKQYVETCTVHEDGTDRPFSGRVVLSDELGIPAEAREAMGFAVLGALSQDGVPITLPAVTGADAPGMAGAWVFPHVGGE